MRLLEAKDLDVGYVLSGHGHRTRERRLVFSGLRLAVPRGRFIVLLGPNGSGKSTLIRSLSGMQGPLSGTVELQGRDLTELEPRERALGLALVLTERFDAGWFNVFDIVAFGRFPHETFGEEPGPEDRAIIRDSLAAVGMADFEDRLFSELSDGERQKVLIARALAQESPLLMLDEPTAFLDAPARGEIFHLLRRQARDGKGVLMSTHEVDLALREADEVWLVDRRRGLVIGAPEELALSGAIGAAFDGPQLSFDPASGRFVAASTSPRPSIAVHGDDAVGLAWTLRLVERLGMSLAEGVAGYDAELRVIAKGPTSPETGGRVGVESGRRVWAAKRGREKGELILGNLAEVEAFLRDIGSPEKPAL
ncbi:MAG TPA: ABC transporter ATP-binding protein [Rectinemataceae bacterium]|nr:ABC transporter ATP-binding protein [Rectinemataceae bacterium]